MSEYQATGDCQQSEGPGLGQAGHLQSQPDAPYDRPPGQQPPEKPPRLDFPRAFLISSPSHSAP